MKLNLYIFITLIGMLSGCMSIHTQDSDAGLATDLTSGLGDQWDVSLRSNILTICSTTDLAWVFVPPSSSHGALDNVYQEPFCMKYRIAPLVSQQEYRKQYIAQHDRKQELQQKIAQLEQSGMPRDAKGVLRPRNTQERSIVTEYRKAIHDTITLPVYHYKNRSLFNAEQRPVMENYEMSADEPSEQRVREFWKRIETVLSKYKKTQQNIRQVSPEGAPSDEPSM